MPTIEQIKKNGFLKVSGEIISATRSQLAKLFNVESDKHSFHIQNKGKEDRRVWSVIFESKKWGKYNHLLKEGTEIRETLKMQDRFPMKEGELRAAFRSKGNLNSWEFLGVFKFIKPDKPNNDEKNGMPSNSSGYYTNCYERVSVELKLEDWQNEK